VGVKELLREERPIRNPMLSPCRATRPRSCFMVAVGVSPVKPLVEPSATHKTRVAPGVRRGGTGPAPTEPCNTQRGFLRGVTVTVLVARSGRAFLMASRDPMAPPTRGTLHQLHPHRHVVARLLLRQLA